MARLHPLPSESPAMDVRRRRRAPWRLWLACTAGVALIAALAVAWPALTRGGEAGPVVDRSTIVTDVARVGTIERSIAAAGVLASETARVVSSAQSGVVTAVLVKPGAEVNAGDPIVRLDNPDLDAQVLTAKSALRVAQAQLASAREQARSSALVRQSNVAGAQAQMREDETNARALESLHRDGLVPDVQYRIAKIKAEQSRQQVAIGRSQIGVDRADQLAKVAAAQAQVEQASAQLANHEAQVGALVVTAGGPGVVQSVKVDPGAHVDIGSEVARIADQRALKAVLQVPESQVHDVFAGMQARVDTGNGTATGRVVQIAPSAVNGSVAVDVAFTRQLPPGARPDLNVDATIELERIPKAVSIARPAGAADDTTITVFRLVRDGSRAVPVRVRLGRGSLERVQVVSGLSRGDAVIVSDTSAYGGQPVLRLR
jgi:HlyD family secretion protein